MILFLALSQQNQTPADRLIPRHARTDPTHAVVHMPPD
jgi:hypothetical protein